MHRQRRTKITLCSALAAALTLAACGGSGATSQSSTATAASATQPAAAVTTQPTTSSHSTSAAASTSGATAKLPTADIELTSSAKVQPLSPAYTCDGANTSVPFSWSKLPRNTAEVDLLLLSNTPQGGLFVDWAVAGLKPSLRSLPAGKLPAGAIVGRNGFGQVGYSLCPPSGSAVKYVAVLFALPRRIPVKRGFNAATLRTRALHTAESEGLYGFSYKRA